MVIVSDTTPLSNLLQINRLSLLREIYNEVLIPPAVFDELSALPAKGISILPIIDANWIKVSIPHDQVIVQGLAKELDIGEAEAIALAIEKSAALLLIDEKQGRLIAEKHQLSIIGTLGVLLKAKQMGLIGKVKPELDNLMAINFWIGQNLYDRILNLSNE